MVGLVSFKIKVGTMFSNSNAKRKERATCLYIFTHRSFASQKVFMNINKIGFPKILCTCKNTTFIGENIPCRKTKNK